MIKDVIMHEDLAASGSVVLNVKPAFRNAAFMAFLESAEHCEPEITEHKGKTSFGSGIRGTRASLNLLQHRWKATRGLDPEQCDQESKPTLIAAKDAHSGGFLPPLK